MNNMKIANFFWYGTMSKLEKACIKSFIKNNFIVKLWSYKPSSVDIDGITICDANLVLPRKNLFIYSQNKQKRNLAAFSDVFRINLINRVDGWWFDTDCYCLKPSDLFVDMFNKNPIVISYENNRNSLCGCSAFYIADSNLKNDLLNEVNNILPRLEIRAGLRGVTAIQGREVYRREGKGGERRGVVKKGEG